MKKPTSLREALVAAIPELKRNPADLAIWVEGGKVRARQTQSMGFSLEYPLSVLVENCETDIALVAFAVTRWLRRHQPNLLSAGEGDSFEFEADILDNERADIVFTLQLTEAITASPLPDGGYSLDYVTEPADLFEDDTPAADLPDAPPIAGASTDAIVAN